MKPYSHFLLSLGCLTPIIFVFFHDLPGDMINFLLRKADVYNIFVHSLIMAASMNIIVVPGASMALMGVTIFAFHCIIFRLALIELIQDADGSDLKPRRSLHDVLIILQGFQILFKIAEERFDAIGVGITLCTISIVGSLFTLMKFGKVLPSFVLAIFLATSVIFSGSVNGLWTLGHSVTDANTKALRNMTSRLMRRGPRGVSSFQTKIAWKWLNALRPIKIRFGLLNAGRNTGLKFMENIFLAAFNLCMIYNSHTN